MSVAIPRLILMLFLVIALSLIGCKQEEQEEQEEQESTSVKQVDCQEAVVKWWRNSGLNPGRNINLRDLASYSYRDFEGNAECENYEEFVKTFITSEASIDRRDSTHRTVLHYSVIFDARDLTEILVRLGADINAKSSKGVSILSYSGSYEDSKFLLSKGAKVNTHNVIGTTELMARAESVTFSLLELKLLAHGANCVGSRQPQR